MMMKFIAVPRPGIYWKSGNTLIRSTFVRSGKKSRVQLNRLNSTMTESPIMIGCYSKVPTKNTNSKNVFYSAGVRNVLSLGNSRFIVGTGNGTLELIEILNAMPTMRKSNKFNYPLIKTVCIIKIQSTIANYFLSFQHISVNLNNSSITSIIRYKEHSLLIGTLMCEIYQVQLSNFNQQLLETCHIEGINALAFPQWVAYIFNYSKFYVISTMICCMFYWFFVMKQLLPSICDRW